MLDGLFADNTLNKRQYLKNVTIFKDGDTAQEAYLIAEGNVKVYRELDGVRYDIANLGPGDILGEMALIKKTLHTSNAVAVDRTLLVIITKDLLEEKLSITDPLIRALVHLYIKRLYKSNDDLQSK